MPMTTLFSLFVLLIAVLYYQYNYNDACPKYPNQRVLHWFEFATDGFAPNFVAEDGRLVLASFWYRIFGEGHIESSGLLDLITTEVSRLAGSGNDPEKPVQV